MRGQRGQGTRLALGGALALSACWDFEIRCAADGSCPAGRACDAFGRCALAADRAPDDVETSAGPAEVAPLTTLPGAVNGTVPEATPPVNAAATPSDAGAALAALPPPACGLRNHGCCTDAAACNPGLYCDTARGVCATCATFRGLGFLSDQTDSHALGVSADGSLALGTARAQFSVNEAMLWRIETGASERFARSVSLERGVLVNLQTAASAASADGRVIVGYGEIDVQLADNRSSRSESVFFARLPDRAQPIFAGRALALSADGAAFVGWSNDPSEAYWWTAASGPLRLGATHGLAQSQALGISADGSVAVGFGTLPSGDSHALLWTVAGELLDLGALPGDVSSAASAVNADGSLVVGTSNGSSARHAFRWRSDAGLESLPGLETASATTAAGDVVVGTSAGRAFLWDAGVRGARALSDELGALVPEGWVLQAATGISADGAVLVGYGQSPNAPVEEAWVATLGPACAK